MAAPLDSISGDTPLRGPAEFHRVSVSVLHACIPVRRRGSVHVEVRGDQEDVDATGAHRIPQEVLNDRNGEKEEQEEQWGFGKGWQESNEGGWWKKEGKRQERRRQREAR